MSIQEIVRVERAKVLASLARLTRDLTLAEDAVQDASISALEVWPRTGIPSDPAAWLAVAARRRAIDLIRREARRVGKESDSAHLAEMTVPLPSPTSVVNDDLLRLIFVCCHPALAIESRVALALRTLGGLSTDEVAAVLLVSPATMGKRLTRAKQKISAAGIPFALPRSEDLQARSLSVALVIQLIYTSGHASLIDTGVRVDLCDEAIRLARLLNQLLSGNATAEALLSQLLTTDARRPTRVDDNDDIVLLADQDRGRWNQAMILEGLELLESSIERTNGSADTFQLQAAISACHATAVTYAETDWAEISRLYELLEQVNPSPVVRLNRAVAVAEHLGAKRGLELLNGLDTDPFKLLCVKAELHARDGNQWCVSIY